MCSGELQRSKNIYSPFPPGLLASARVHMLHATALTTHQLPNLGPFPPGVSLPEPPGDPGSLQMCLWGGGPAEPGSCCLLSLSLIYTNRSPGAGEKLGSFRQAEPRRCPAHRPAIFRQMASAHNSSRHKPVTSKCFLLPLILHLPYLGQNDKSAHA